MKLLYNTRDGSGNDIVKEVELNDYDDAPEYDPPVECGLCGASTSRAIKAKDVVSGHFTDWNYVTGDYICPRCARNLGLYKYSFIETPTDIKLYNIREMADAVINPPEPPFKIVISKSQKKHLFYKARWGWSRNNYPINLEEETIIVNRATLSKQFAFISALLALGEIKAGLAEGHIRLETLQQVGKDALKLLWLWLARDRMIQIPLFLAQPAAKEVAAETIQKITQEERLL